MDNPRGKKRKTGGKVSNNKQKKHKYQEKQPQKKSPGVSSLQAKFRAKLESGQFRWLNEQLYTKSSEDAVKLFADTPKLFDVYHKGFELQVEKWPLNPVNVIIKRLKKLPEKSSIGDFGCGNALIARTLSPKWIVHSFDLAETNEFVTVANSASVPLQDQVLDVAVFCLSLMGIDFHRFIEEARRVLKPNGLLIVAEVKSRFGNEAGSSEESMLGGIKEFKRSLGNIGFKLEQEDTSNTMFVMFQFRKIELTDKKQSNQQSAVLKACIYKRR